MPQVTYRHPNGTTTTVTVKAGTSVMQAAIANNIAGIVGECGGQAMCATCHVYVDPAQGLALPKLSDDEDALLDGTAADRKPTSRLGCQIKVTDALDGLVVDLPDRQI